MTRVLVTTTSFQDTPGEHHEILEKTGWEIVPARGPLTEEEMLKLVGDVDAFICGDDEITRAVIQKALPRLKIISKYGIGIDKIDVAAATELGVPVLNTPGVNHTTVAEHMFGLLLSLMKHIPEEVEHTRHGRWKRLTGNEIMGKTLGVVGLGRIGKEVATRAVAFGMKVAAYDIYWDEDFAKTHDVTRADSVDQLFRECDIISLHTNLTPETRAMVNRKSIGTMKKNAVILNCSRGELVDTEAMAEALETGALGGYGADVLDEEPPRPNHPLLSAKNCIITPHIGSRTYESVVRQATKAIQNLSLALEGKEPLAQVNDVPIVRKD